ncbi:hypothetical protein [Lysinibacter sp. HNR]|uniref:DUF4097 family beta strand repeat-containing protein n=1 Tax=Lysinibacter sp. HNR TaxID=3031408 RepID=UPI002435067C|nr:hypothetical protein [Lysinibacter sp. HNR]WGD36492.1 hypothetical protein FrondiHNR_08385 [Lysinibacter sp. HNR]
MDTQNWIIQPGDTQTITIDRVASLKLGLLGGQVDVIAHDEPGARIEVHSVTGKALNIKAIGESLEVDHPQIRWDNFLEVFGSFPGRARVDMSILVPRSLALTMGTVSASGLVSGVRSNARISTVSGELILDGLTGALTIESVSGNVSIRNHEGQITAESVTGEVLCTGRLSSFSAESVSGGVFLDLAGTPDSITTNTVSGNTTVRLDEGVSARLHINSVSGKVQYGDQLVTGVRGVGHSAHLGPAGSSPTSITVNSVSGGVSIMHRTSAQKQEFAP